MGRHQCDKGQHTTDATLASRTQSQQWFSLLGDLKKKGLTPEGVSPCPMGG